MESGVYHMDLGAHPTIILEFTSPFVKQPMSVTTEKSKHDVTDVLVQKSEEKVRQTWESEKIQDFVQRLGFYDAKEARHSEMIDKFFYINEVSS